MFMPEPNDSNNSIPPSRNSIPPFRNSIPPSRFSAFARMPKKKWKIFCLVALALWPVEEFIKFKWGKELWPFLPNIRTFMLGLATFIGVIDYFTDTEKVSVIRPPDMDFWTHGLLLCKQLKRNFLQNTLVGLILAGLFLLVVPAAAVHYELWPTLVHWATTPYKEAATSSEVPPPDSSGQAAPEDPELPAPQDSGDTPSSKLEEPESEEPEPPPPSLARRLKLDDTPPEEVSDEEYQRIFFLQEPYLIQDWDSQEAVTEIVRKFVQDQRQKQLPPRSSIDEISTKAQDPISRASNQEASMTTAEELRNVITLREYVYLYLEDPEEPEKKGEPIYSVAKLIRENYCLYGDAYALQNKSYSYACQFYEWSILWGFRTLEYDVTEDALYKNLDILVERYDKIAGATDDSTEYMYADKLSAAFRQIADEFA